MTIQTKLIGNLDGSLTVVSKQDKEILKSIADANATDRFEQGRNRYKGDSQFSHHVAQIPMIILEKLMRDGTFKDPDRMKEWLNRPENEPWRSTKGKL
jgi:hypothetical protein